MLRDFEWSEDPLEGTDMGMNDGRNLNMRSAGVSSDGTNDRRTLLCSPQREDVQLLNHSYDQLQNMLVHFSRPVSTVETKQLFITP